MVCRGIVNFKKKTSKGNNKKGKLQLQFIHHCSRMFQLKQCFNASHLMGRRQIKYLFLDLMFVMLHKQKHHLN